MYPITRRIIGLKRWLEGNKTRKILKKRGIRRVFLHLHFCAKGEVAGIAEAGDDIAFCRELVVDGAAPDAALGLPTQDIFDPDGAGDGDDNMDLRGVSFFAQVLDGFDEGGAGGQHGVGNDNHPAFELGAGDIVEPDLETAVALVFAVSRDEPVVGLIEEI